jgi:hypothetical protein
MDNDDDAHRERLKAAGLIIADAIADALERVRREVPGLTRGNGQRLGDGSKGNATVRRLARPRGAENVRVQCSCRSARAVVSHAAVGRST